jgi:hypothetical protein
MLHSTRRAGTVLVALMLASVLLLALAPVSQGQTPEGRPRPFLPLFTRVRERAVLGTSPRRGSKKFAKNVSKDGSFSGCSRPRASSILWAR